MIGPGDLSKDGLILSAGRSKYTMPRDDNGFIEPIQSEKDDREVSLPSYEILTYPADFTLEVLVNKWSKKEIRVPELQRQFVWTQVQASKLIESFLLGLPVPPVFFYSDRKDNALLVVDGQQRLRSIIYFFSGLFGEASSEKKVRSFNLIGLDEKSPYRNITFQQLKESNQSVFNRLKNSVLRAFVMKQLDPADDTSIFQVFERLNSGGVVLQGQEIRNCIYHGKFNTMLKELNEYPSWRKIIGKKYPDNRMRDIELILRFLALREDLAIYKKPMKKFLNDFMEKHKNSHQENLNKFGDLFKKTADSVISYLGEKPFHIHAGLNAAVYDSVFVSFASNVDELDSRKGKLKQRYASLLKDEDYVVSVSAGTTDR